MKKQTGICTCGKEFSYFPSAYHYKRKQHCSRECQKASKRIWTNCPACGKEFWFHKSWGRIYCSRKCSASKNSKNNLGKHASGVGLIVTKCEYCGKGFLKRHDQILKTKRHFCSRRCFGNWQSENINGISHPNWLGGPLHYYGNSWESQRKKSRKRDKYTCQRCGKNEKQLGRELDVHHKIPFREFGVSRYEEANHLDNLVSLCPTCHTLTENNK